MDRAVLAAYGWSDISVPPFVTPATAADKKAFEAFDDEVIDRLFVLNAQRAEEERVKGLTGGKKGKAKSTARVKGDSSRNPGSNHQLPLLDRDPEDPS
jgi:hypothetical protein